MNLVVRTKDKLKETLDLLSQANIQADGFEISELNYNRIDPGDADIMVVTSSNSLICIPQTKIPMLCVGEKTAEEAQSMGCRVLFTGSNGAEEVAQELLKNHVPQKVVHVSGDQSDHSWYKQLIDAGFEVSTQYSYGTQYAFRFPNDVFNNIKAEKYKVIWGFSVKGVEQTIKIMSEVGVNPKYFSWVVMSDAVAKKLPEGVKFAVSSDKSLRGMAEAAKTLLLS